MGEYNIKLSGWKAIIVVIVLIAILGIRISSISNKKADKNLMYKLKSVLLSDYLPDDAARMKKIYETGDEEELSAMAKSITTTKMDIESVKASYSILDFSTKEKDVVIKVVYSLSDANGIRKKGVRYYLFAHNPIGNTWRSKYDVGVIRYFLNFL